MIRLLAVVAAVSPFLLSSYPFLLQDPSDAGIGYLIALALSALLAIVAIAWLVRDYQRKVHRRRAAEKAEKTAAEEAARLEEMRRQALADLDTYNAEVRVYNEAYRQRQGRMAQVEMIFRQLYAEATVRHAFLRQDAASVAQVNIALRETLMAKMTPEDLAFLRLSGNAFVRDFLRRHPDWPEPPALPLPVASPSHKEGIKRGWIRAYGS